MSGDLDAPPRGSPRALRLMAIARWGLLAIAIAGCVYAYVFAGAARPSDVARAAARYHCPMHPQVTSDAPGECPICRMDLEPIAGARAEAAASTAAPKGAPAGVARAYTCPMHPEIIAHAPGRCPLCKMPLEPLAPDAGAAIPAPPAAAPVAPAAPASLAPVQLTLNRVQAMGVRTTIAASREVAPVVRVTATVQASETGAAEVHVRSPGFVERIAVQETGVTVARGQELFALYSPEIYQAETELVAARGWASSDAGAGMLGRARRKLELLGMTDAAIDRVVASGEPIRAVPVTAPAGGVVRRKAVVLGSYVTPEATLYEIVDLSRVYVVGELYPRDVEQITIGAVGTFAPTSRRGVAIEAKVDLAYPSANEGARTVRVRMTVKNERRVLVPGELGTVTFALPRRTATLVPRDALIDTGREAYVFVDLGEGRFEPRAVTVGAELPEGLEIRAGVATGERVVSGATFLLDSESRLRASLAEKP